MISRLKDMSTELDKIIRITKNGLSLSVWVQPRASKNAFAGIYHNSAKIQLTSPPIDGKANAALCKFLASALAVAKSAVSVTAGHTSRKKVVLVEGCEEKVIVDRLRALIAVK